VPNQPSLSETDATRVQLRQLLEARSYVRVRRSPRFAGDLDGFIAGVGTKWALLQTTRNGGYLDGWNAFRIADVRRVREKNESFERLVSEQQSSWPPAPPLPMDLGRTADLLRGVSAEPLVAIEKERERAATWIGRFEGVEKGRLWLHEADPQGRWHKEQLGYRLRAITLITLRTEYLRALASVLPAQPDVG
jgi:hypothetical protein